MMNAQRDLSSASTHPRESERPTLNPSSKAATSGMLAMIRSAASIGS